MQGLLLVLLLLLTGCSSGNPPQVVDLSAHQGRSKQLTMADKHTVRHGETLYSIAWRHGWDYRELAKANAIAAPYTIYPGQTIRLDKKSAGTASSNVASTALPKPTPPSLSEEKPSALVAKPPARQPVPKPVEKTTSSPAAKPAAPSKPAVSVAASGPVRWQWPATGDLVEGYSTGSQGRRGIAIGGPAGAPIRAAAAGRVVYRGSGLTGYGNLLIIKHSDRWLSAYAHNDQMSVKEGEAVSAGQLIATMGSSGTFRNQLHFEIRRDGQPVDPLQHLPKR